MKKKKKVLHCSHIKIVDPNGMVRMTIGMHSDDSAAVRFYDPSGHVVAELSQTPDGCGLILADSDRDDWSGAFMRVKSTGESQIGQFKAGGALVFLQKSVPDEGSTQVHFDKYGKDRLILGVGQLGWPELTILNSEGKQRITVSDRGNDLCGIWLSNMRGTPRASMALTSSSSLEVTVPARTVKVIAK